METGTPNGYRVAWGPHPLVLPADVRGEQGWAEGCSCGPGCPSPGQAISSAPRPLAALGTCLGGSGRAPSGGDAASSSSCSLPLPRWLRRRWRRAPGAGARGEGGGTWKTCGGEGAAWGRGRSKAGVLARWVLEPGSGYNEHPLQPPFSRDPEGNPPFSHLSERWVPDDVRREQRQGLVSGF